MSQELLDKQAQIGRVYSTEYRKIGKEYGYSSKEMNELTEWYNKELAKYGHSEKEIKELDDLLKEYKNGKAKIEKDHLDDFKAVLNSAQRKSYDLMKINSYY